MRGIFQRVLSGVFHRPPPGTPVPADFRQAVPRGSPAATGRAPAQATTAAAAPMAALARRPLIDRGGEIVGFEFRVGEELQARLGAQSTSAAQSAHATALLSSAQWVAKGRRVGLARVPADWLLRLPALDLGAGTMVALEHSPQAQPDHAELEKVVNQLRTQGVKVGWETVFGLALAPDFVLLRQGDDPMAALLEAAKTWPAVRQGAAIVATDIAGVPELELALQGGVALACGALTAASLNTPRVPSRSVPPELRRIGHLLQQLMAGVDTSVIVGDIKGDVGLSVRLLCRIHSARYSQLKACSSIEQAVLMLGRNELYRWLSLLLVQFAGTRPSASALQEITLWRSRLLELLASHSREPSPHQLFTLGLASMLGPLLGLDMAEVVDILKLPDAARQALIDQSGPWHRYLRMAELLQTQTLDGPDELSDSFGGPDQVLALSAQAWEWAADNANHDTAAQPAGALNS